MSKSMFSTLCLAFTAAVASAASYEVNVATGTQTNFTSAQLEAIRSGTFSEIRKTGAGTLRITDATTIKDFSGKIVIAEGIYDVGISSGALGTGGSTDATGTTVLSGGALHFSHTDKSTESYKSERLHISGDGPADATYKGAIVRVNRVVYLGRLMLDGDASIGGSSTDKFLNTTERNVDLGGHTLTVWTGASLENSVIMNPGHLDVRGGMLWLPYKLAYLPDATRTNEIRIGAGVTVSFVYDYAIDIPYTFVVKGDSTFQITSSGSLKCTDFKFHSPIRLENGAALTIDNPQLPRVDFFGDITGSGSVVKKVCNARPNAVWLHGTNTYDGVTTVSGPASVPNVIVAMKPESLPGWKDGRADGAFSTHHSGYGVGLKTAANPLGWEDDDVLEILTRVRAQGDASNYNRFYLAVEKDDVGEYAQDLDLRGPYPYFGSIGGGTVKLGGIVTGNKNPYFYPFAVDDTLSFTRKAGDVRTNSFKEIRQYCGTLAFDDAGTLEMTTSTSLGLGWVEGILARVVFKGNTTWNTGHALKNPVLARGRGIAEFVDGADIACGLTSGDQEGSVGSFYVRGGKFSPQGNPIFGSAVGAEGYLEVSGGECVFPQPASYLGYQLAEQTAAAPTAERALGVIYQTGGAVMRPKGSNFAVGLGGNAVCYVKGGTFSMPLASFNAPMPLLANDKTGGSANVTVAGTGVLTADSVKLAGRDDSSGHLNLIDGGVVAVNSVQKYPTGSSIPLGENRKAYVGFNGGVLKAIRNGTLLGGSDVDHHTVYAHGAVFDTDGYEASVKCGLAAPTGTGIVAISLPAVPLAGYIAPPYVKIVGEGQGASAVAEFDSASGTVTGVTVSSPGWGYASDSTVVTLVGGGGADGVICGVTVAADAGTGGLVKRGEGVLALYADNSYAGPTVIEKGSLSARSAGAIPAGSEVVLKGGTLEVAAGVMPTSWRVDIPPEELALKKKYTLVRLTSADPAAVLTQPTSGVPKFWHLRVTGTTLQMVPDVGGVILLR